VLVADFSNHTGDPIFDGTLEPVVKIALEGAGFIAAYDRTQMRAIGAQPVSGKLDEIAARRSLWDRAWEWSCRDHWIRTEAVTLCR
jgi:hypothetical protein